MSKGEGLNRRRFPRGSKYPCLVTFRYGQEKTQAILTHTENIGVGGIGVILKEEMKLFVPVEIELDLLDFGEHLKCRGKVVWSARRRHFVREKKLFYDTGIEFENLKEEELHRLEEIVSHLITREKKESKS